MNSFKRLARGPRFDEGREPREDADYARVAGAMPFIEGTLAYEIYREAEPS